MEAGGFFQSGLVSHIKKGTPNLVLLDTTGTQMGKWGGGEKSASKGVREIVRPRGFPGRKRGDHAGKGGVNWEGRKATEERRPRRMTSAGGGGIPATWEI